MMRRTWFLLGLVTGLGIAMHPVWDSVRRGVAILAVADERVRKVEAEQARKDRIESLDHTPVGWGETIDNDGTDSIEPMRQHPEASFRWCSKHNRSSLNCPIGSPCPPWPMGRPAP